MKVKYSVIPFIPAFLAMLFFKLMSIFGVDGNGTFMGMNSMNITYTVIGIAVGLFVVCILMNLFDRKTAPVYPVKRNIAAGLFSVLSGLMIMAYSISTAVNAFQEQANQEYLLLSVICAVLSVPAGISLALMSRVHFAGKNVVSSLSVLFVFPSLWGCAELVNEFLQATKASISSKDLTGLFCFIFISLFYFSGSMVVARIKGRNPVKGVFIYGLPMAALSLTFGIYELCKMSREGFGNSGIFFALMLITSALYALSFIFELFANNYTKDDLEIVSSLPGDEDDFSGNKAESAPEAETVKKKLPVSKKSAEQAVNKPEKTDVKEAATVASSSQQHEIGDLVFSDRSAKDIADNVEYDDDYYTTAKGMDDFIIGYSYDDGETPQKSVKPEKPQKENARSLKKQEKAERKAAKKLEAEKKAAEKAEKQEKQTADSPKNESAKADAKTAENKTVADVPAAAKNAVPSEKNAVSNRQAVEEVLASNIARNKKKTPNISESSNVDKLTEELRKAAQSRKTADKINSQKAKASDLRMIEEVKRAEAARQAQNVQEIARADRQRQEEESRRAEEAKRAEQARIAADVKKVEEARRLAAQKQADDAKSASAAKRADEAKRAAAAKKAEEEKQAAARRAEEAKRAEEARKAEEARIAEEARKAEETKRAEEARKAEEAKRAEEARLAEEAKEDTNPMGIEEREEVYREKLSAVDKLLRELGEK